MVEKKIILSVAMLSLLAVGIFNYSDLSCNEIKLKGLMNFDDLTKFNEFIEKDICELTDCTTGEIYPVYASYLKGIRDNKPDVFRRIHYYMTRCK